MRKILPFLFLDLFFVASLFFLWSVLSGLGVVGQAHAQYGSFNLNVQSSPIGGVVISSNGGNFYGGVTNYSKSMSGSQVNVELYAPSAVSGYTFSGWSGPCSTVTGTTCRFANLNSTATVVANYVANGSISVDLKANGSDGPITVPSGSTVIMTWTSTGDPQFCFTSGLWFGGSKPNSNTTGDPVVVTESGPYQIVCYTTLPTGTVISDDDIVTINVTVVTPPDLNFDDAASEIQFYQDGSYSPGAYKSTYNEGDTIYVQVKVVNLNSAITTPFRVGFYLNSADPGCNAAPTNSKLINSMAPGAVDTWQFTAVAPAGGQPVYTAYAFADYQCAVAETNELNNKKTKNYLINPAPAWFETVGGDVGSAGPISASKAPPVSKYNSTYLIASTDFGDADVVTQNAFRLTGYTSPHRLIPGGGTYSYLAERFRSKATTPSCTLTGVSANNLFQCQSSVSIGATTMSSGNNAFFIDGDLTITGNLVLPDANSTVVVLVNGNIVVNSDVTRLDGIYVANAGFSDVTAGSSAPVLAPQLVVNGAVWAGNVSLARTLGGALCGAICNNGTDPAERIVFDAKYLFLMRNVLGSPSLTWQEVAP